jgi:hypothetical protein
MWIFLGKILVILICFLFVGYCAMKIESPGWVKLVLTLVITIAVGYQLFKKDSKATTSEEETKTEVFSES